MADDPTPPSKPTKEISIESSTSTPEPAADDEALPPPSPNRSTPSPESNKLEFMETATTADQEQDERPQDNADMEVEESAPKATPMPTDCYGVRAYDGGHYDVGSFFVFHRQEEPEGDDTTTTEEVVCDGTPPRKFVTGTTANTRVIGNGSDRDGVSSAARPLEYRFLEGLKVVGRGGEEVVTGGGSDAAMQAFVELEKQVAAIRRALRVAASGKRDSTGDAGNREGGTNNDNNNNGSVSTGDDDKNMQCFALGNTDDNDSVQGLIRDRECTWLGTFGLPPVPKGQEEEVLDIWPKRVIRFADFGAYGVLALEGDSKDTRSLVAISSPDTESNGESADRKGHKEEPAEVGARKAYAFISRAVSEIRALIPNLPDPPQSSRSPSSVSEPAEGTVNGTVSNGNEALHSVNSGGGGGDDSDDEGEERQLERGKRVGPQMSLRARKTPEPESTPMREREGEQQEEESGGSGTRGRDRAVDVEEESTGAAEAGATTNNRNPGSRKRPRIDRGYPVVDNDQMHGENLRKTGIVEATGHGVRNFRDEEGPGEEAMEEDDGAGAGEMTVVAVRTSLLRNRADEGPNPEEEEWEIMVRRFIRYVDNLQPGPTQEELSLMFAAALDPTLVRMRAANALLIELAEECAMPEPGMDQDDDDDGEDEYGAHGAVGNHAGGFKVRLELDASDGDEPPPEGIELLLKAVGAARGAVEAAARARACVAAAGDTLGGLHELKADYKRSLPPGPREPIQCIIAEEQARVRGYATAHEDIEAQRLHELRLRGRGVGDAYRAMEGEPGWNGVKRQVDAFLRRFAAYCVARLPREGSDPGLLALDIAMAWRGGEGPKRL